MTDQLVKVLPPNEAAKLLGISNATLWRWANGRGHEGFPKPRKLGPRKTYWLVDELIEFQRKQMSPTNGS